MTVVTMPSTQTQNLLTLTKMKTFFLSFIFALLSLVSSAQTWYGNNPTFTDGFAGSVSYTGIATIEGNVTFTNGGSLSTVDVKSGAILTLQQDVEFYAGSTIEGGGTILAHQDLAFDLTNTIEGTLKVSGTLSANNPGEVLNGCAFIQTVNLDIHQDNLFSGSGIIYITGVYNSEAGNNYHPLTQSSTIDVTYSGSWTGFGAATKGSATTSACAISTPVTIINFFIREDALNNVTASWTSTIEEDVNNYVIEGSTDGTTFVPLAEVATLAPGGNSAVATDYSTTFNNNLDVVIAGFSVVGIILFVGLLGGTVKLRKALVAPMMVLLIAGASLASCSKTGPKVEHTNKYTYFRLKTNFNDGTFTYLQQQWHISK
jgi:hypothetical protein